MGMYDVTESTVRIVQDHVVLSGMREVAADDPHASCKQRGYGPVSQVRVYNTQ